MLLHTVCAISKVRTYQSNQPVAVQDGQNENECDPSDKHQTR